MAHRQIKTHILLRRGFLAEWEQKNPILSAGQMGVALDVGRCKIGDGTSTWNQLPFFVLTQDLNNYAQIIVKNEQDWASSSFTMSHKGQIYVYIKQNQDNEEITSARVKIGDGKTFILNLPFVDDFVKELLNNHIQDIDVHTTLIEKTFWNNKINIDDVSGVVENTLIFNRN